MGNEQCQTGGTLADSKGEIYQSTKQRWKKEQIGKVCVSAPQRFKKAVHHSEDRPYPQTAEETPCGGEWCHQRSSRLSQLPPGRGSS